MNKLVALFQNKKKNILNLYFTAGYPYLESTKDILEILEQSSVDIIEIGLPYSDPLADGLVIQNSSQQALKNGMTPELLFAELKKIKGQLTKPYLIMGYYNSMLQYGLEKFFKDAHEAGVSGLIFPDMALSDFEQSIQPLFTKYHICPVFLITPETSEERLKKLDSFSKGFLYLVSSSSTTGIENKSTSTDKKTFEIYLQTHSIQNPVLVGFGIKNHTDFLHVCKHAQGAVVGSAYIKTLENCQNSTAIKNATETFLQKLLND